MRVSSLAAPAITIGLILTSGVALLNWQSISDSIRAANFQPSQEIKQLAVDTTMSSSALRTFYATQPSIDGSSGFKNTCHQQHDKGAVLGCYTNDRIYIYDVNNPELTGIKEVTAAHEMLHAVYARMGNSERANVDKLLTSQAKSMEGDSDFKERMKVYKDLDSSSRLDELHSIFGTEYSSVNDKLDKHYERYFDDRQKVVTMYSGYADVFKQLSDDANKLAISLDAQAISINEQKAAYQSESESYSRDVDLFNSRAESNYFTSQSEFYRQRQLLVQRSERLDSQRRAINQAIANYDQDRRRYDGLTAHLSELNSSIDSRSVDPVPEV